MCLLSYERPTNFFVSSPASSYQPNKVDQLSSFTQWLFNFRSQSVLSYWRIYLVTDLAGIGLPLFLCLTVCQNLYHSILPNFSWVFLPFWVLMQLVGMSCWLPHKSFTASGEESGWRWSNSHMRWYWFQRYDLFCRISEPLRRILTAHFFRFWTNFCCPKFGGRGSQSPSYPCIHFTSL